jgi:proteic killer suppression protein
VILSFSDKRTRAFAATGSAKWMPADLKRRALALLTAIDAAQDLQDLASPPGNRLEKLSGDRAGNHSVRINVQWRICFRWTAKGVEDVEIVDYH